MPATLTRPRTTRLLERVTTGGCVDRDAGVIFGVRILGPESPGRKRRYTEQAMRSALSLYEGAVVNIDHPRPGDANRERASADRFGELRNVHFRDGALFGDLHFLRSHPLAPSICESAERGIGGLGLSHNVDGTGRQQDGVYLVEAITHVVSVDIVSSPGTNRTLFESSGDGYREEVRAALTGEPTRRRLREQEGSEVQVVRIEQAKQEIIKALRNIETMTLGEMLKAMKKLIERFDELDQPIGIPESRRRMPTGNAFLESIGVKPRPKRSTPRPETMPRGADFRAAIGL